MTGLPTDLFGMPLVMLEEDFSHARGVLNRAWALQAGRPADSFTADLARLASWFHPKLRGQTLRDRLVDLEPLDVGDARLPGSVLLAAGEGRFLVTPEGRAWMECAHGASTADDRHVIFTAEQGEPYASELLETYRGWSRHRIDDVIQKRTGAGAPMLAAAAGIVLLLLVNRSVGPATAIRRVRDPVAQEKIDDVIADVLEAFAEALGGESKRGRSREHLGLWSGYPLSEARRRLAGGLVLDTDAGSVYIQPQRENEVADFVARDIARRKDASEVKLGRAFSALTDTYRKRLPDLSALGSGFERIGRTDALRDRLLQAVRDRS